MSGELGPEAALALVLERVHPLAGESVALGDALGRVLAEDVVAPGDVPPFDSSAMDGYAVRSADTLGANAERPVRLAVAGESRAGRPASVAVGAGEAVGISTGAVLPAGADAVVRKEDCRRLVDGESETVEALVEVQAGKEVRRAGEDIRAGDSVIGRGATIGPAELGVLASVGADRVECSRRPRLVLLTTGDELVDPGRPLAPGQIRNTNRYAVAAQARLSGAEVARVAAVADDYASTVAAIERGLDADVVVICGGVSVGEHDHVKDALAAAGVERVFWGVALRPGHPTWFGTKGPTLVFGLPGNPVSAMVTFHLFARPALVALTGAVETARRATAIMDEPYRKAPGRAHVLRCRLEAHDDGWHVRPTKAQGSHVLTSMLGTEALALLERERGDVQAGETVEIELLEGVRT